MSVRRRTVAAGLLAWPGMALGQGFAGLGGGGEGYAQVTPGRALRFPADHGAHPGFRIEWWYLTANLEAGNGAPMGLQWTLFRQTATPGGGADGWASAQGWMGNAAVTTADRHVLAEVFARGGIGQAGVALDPFTAWIDDWEMRSTGGADPLDALTLIASGADFAYRLELAAEGPLVLHGQAGYSVKSERGQASYYYSQPFYRARGEILLGGENIAVTGRAWLDREWSSQPLGASQTGWDWFSLHLPGGEKMMAFRVRDDAGGGYTSGTWIGSDGASEALEDGAIGLEPLAASRVAGREIPTRWRVRLAAKGLDIEADALNPDAYMATAFPYWEGPIAYSGSHAGVGYLEMTGY